MNDIESTPAAAVEEIDWLEITKRQDREPRTTKTVVDKIAAEGNVRLPKVATGTAESSIADTHILNIRRTLNFMCGHSTCAINRAEDYVTAYRRALGVCISLRDTFRERRMSDVEELLDDLDDLVSQIDETSEPARNRSPQFKACFNRIDEAIDALDLAASAP